MFGGEAEDMRIVFTNERDSELQGYDGLDAVLAKSRWPRHHEVAYRVAHITDLHLISFRAAQKSTTAQAVLNQMEVGSPRILEDMFGLFRDISVDHLLITGDITHHVDAEGIDLLVSLLDNHGWLSPDTATVLPGNHDIGTYPKRREDLAHFTKVLPPKLEYFGHPRLLDLLVGDNVSHLAADDSVFPCMKRLCDGKLHMLLVDSTGKKRVEDIPLAAIGHLEDQMRSLTQCQSTINNRGPAPLLVALHHAPFDFPRSYEKRRWKRIFRETHSFLLRLRDGGHFAAFCRTRLRADALLHGHLHDPIDIIFGAGGRSPMRILAPAMACPYPHRIGAECEVSFNLLDLVTSGQRYSLQAHPARLRFEIETGRKPEFDNYLKTLMKGDWAVLCALALKGGTFPNMRLVPEETRRNVVLHRLRNSPYLDITNGTTKIIDRMFLRYLQRECS